MPCQGDFKFIGRLSPKQPGTLWGWHHLSSKPTKCRCPAITWHLGVNSIVSVDAIDSDHSLNEAEKNQAFLNYMKHGFYQKSMSKEIEDSLSFTKMQLHDTYPQTWPQIQTQINLQHLTPSQKQEALQMLQHHRESFAKHNLDLGCTNLIEATIRTDATKPRITKYEPLPLNVRPKIHQILDQMHTFGLIKECNEPSNFVSNLLVTKSADGEIKVLLDGRLLNGATELKPPPPQPTVEQLAIISKAKFISLVNLSNAHLQIPIAPEHQPETAFYSDAHGKRYCFTRSPKTLRNSAIILQKLSTGFSHILTFRTTSYSTAKNCSWQQTNLSLPSSHTGKGPSASGPGQYESQCCKTRNCKTTNRDSRHSLAQRKLKYTKRQDFRLQKYSLPKHPKKTKGHSGCNLCLQEFHPPIRRTLQPPLGTISTTPQAI